MFLFFKLVLFAPLSQNLPGDLTPMDKLKLLHKNAEPPTMLSPPSPPVPFRVCMFLPGDLAPMDKLKLLCKNAQHLPLFASSFPRVSFCS